MTHPNFIKISAMVLSTSISIGIMSFNANAGDENTRRIKLTEKQKTTYEACLTLEEKAKNNCLLKLRSEILLATEVQDRKLRTARLMEQQRQRAEYSRSMRSDMAEVRQHKKLK